MPVSVDSTDAEIVAFYAADRDDEKHVAGRSRPALLREHAVAAAVTQCGAKTVLDVGCGDGHLAALFASIGVDVTLVDATEGAVDAAWQRVLAAGHDAESIIALAEDLDVVEAFDAVTCCETIEHVRDPRAVFARLWAASRDVVVLTTPVGTCYDDPGHLHHWEKPEDLIAALGVLDLTKRVMVSSIESQWGDGGLVYVLLARKEIP
jgi:SAM-dependent methyltransferase